MSLVTPLILRGTAKWKTLNAREKRLALLATFIIFAAFICVLYDWSAQNLARLGRALPQARASLIRMQDQSAELTRLKSLPALPVNNPNALKEAALAAATARNIPITLTLNVEGLKFEGTVPLVSLTDWMAHLQTNLHLTVSKMTLTTQDGAIKVSGTLKSPGDV